METKATAAIEIGQVVIFKTWRLSVLLRFLGEIDVSEIRPRDALIHTTLMLALTLQAFTRLQRGGGCLYSGELKCKYSTLLWVAVK